MIATIKDTRRSKTFNLSQASSLAGKLRVSLTQCFGKFGWAKVKPIRRKIYESRFNLNWQLVSALNWWVVFLHKYRPRPIPLSLNDRNVVISYSVGEGANAGIGVGLWFDPSKTSSSGVC